LHGRRVGLFSGGNLLHGLPGLLVEVHGALF
jgi:hypothetical protein